MQNRLRLLMGATALLYLGPLLAGLGGFGWPVVPVFAAIFLLWLVILRPQEWPQTRADWQNPDALVALAGRGAVQLLLVAVLFGIGRGIGGLLAALPPFPIMLPIAISFLSIPLARLVWNPALAIQTDSFLNDAISQLEAAGRGGPVPKAVTEGLIAPLLALPDDVAPATLRDHLSALAPHLDHQALLDALLSRARSGALSRAGQKALMIAATSPAVAEALAGGEWPMHAFDAASGDPDLLAIFAPACTALIAEDPEAWPDCPRTDLVRAAAATARPDVAAALFALADAQDRAAPCDAAQSA